LSLVARKFAKATRQTLRHHWSVRVQYVGWWRCHPLALVSNDCRLRSVRGTSIRYRANDARTCPMRPRARSRNARGETGRGISATTSPFAADTRDADPR
jgi:hypothetical protein